MAGRANVKFDQRQWRKLIKTSLTKIKKGDSLLKTAYATVGFRNVIKHFKDEKGPGGAWVRRKDSKPHGLLKDTGKLRGGFLPSNVRRVTRKAILIFNSTIYSGVHDRGDSSKNIPKREFLWFDGNAMKAMARVVTSKIFK